MWSCWYDLLFPPSCLACSEQLLCHEAKVCLACLCSLPFLSGTGKKELRKKCHARWPVAAAEGLLHFIKGGKLQRLLHAMKYEGQADLWRTWGHALGRQLCYAGVAPQCDQIIEIPLHPDRLRVRPYNQAALLAEGLCDSLGLPYTPGPLTRSQPTPTQTGKSRVGRWLNVSGSFLLEDPSRVKGRHCLLVDDVITTGATLGAAAATLLGAGASRVSVAVLAVAY